MICKATFNTALFTYKDSFVYYCIITIQINLAKMSVARLCIRSARSLAIFKRPISTTSCRMNGSEGAGGELGVGELQGAKFRIEPLRRTGEDPDTMRARLLCSRPIQTTNDILNRTNLELH